MMVLGSMLTKVNSLNIGADALFASDFYYQEHQTIFSVLQIFYRKDKPADIHLISEELKRTSQLEEIGGIAYLISLAQYAGTSAYIEEYVQQVKNKSILRRMIEAAQEIEKTSLEGPEDVHQSLDDAQAKFFAISQQVNRNVGVQIKDLLVGKGPAERPYLRELESRQELFLEKGEEEKVISGLPTGFSDLDHLINGLASSNLIICAARPAMGKTAFALNVAATVCFSHHLAVGIFSLEMSAKQLLHRMVCFQSEVESQKIITGSLDGAEYQRVVEAVHAMESEVMIIDDQPGLTITDLKARARRIKEVYHADLFIVDYLQLLSSSGFRSSGEYRQQEISEISRNLKNLAREIDTPVLCLCQLSRKVEERVGHRPMMSDLRESGAIEQDADVVLFLLRREYYDPYDKPGMGEVIVGKNRHGAIGTVEVVYRKELAQFVNYSPQAPETSPFYLDTE